MELVKSVKVTLREYELLMSLPRRYRYIQDAYNDAKLAGELKKESLYLWGDTGSGKTVLAMMILRQLAAECHDVKFVSYPEFIFDLQTGYDNAAEKLIEIKKFPGCLMLDDFGAEKLTDFVRQTSYLIINYREQWQLQTIITSNFSLDEIDANIDRRLSSRICGMSRVIERKGDRRLNARKLE